MKLRRIVSSFAVIGCASLILGCATTRSLAKNEPPPVEAQAVSPSPEPEIPLPDPLSRGYELEAAQQWREAIQFYAVVLKEQPANATALHRLGVIATIQDDDEAASNYYRRAIELDPYNAALLADAGYFQLLREQYELAALLLQQALVLEPDNERVVNNLAMVQGLRGEFDMALVLFRRVNPPAVALQHLAALHEQRGEWQLALACYLEAASVNPEVNVPESVLAKVEELRRRTPDVKAVATIVAETTPPPITDHDTAVPSTELVPRPSRPIIHIHAPAKSLDETPIAPKFDVAVHTNPAPAMANEADFFPDDFPTSDDAMFVETGSADLEDQQTVTPTSRTTISVDDHFDMEEAAPARVSDAALDGCCPVALRDVAQVIDGRPEFCVRHQGVLYALSTADAVRRFREQPERYAPSASGLDLIAVRSGRIERGSLHYSTWFRNRLYLFTSAERVDEFRSDPLRYVDLD